MFDLQLDLKMYFIPPMDENGNAIRLTRKLQLPFPPFNDLAIYNAAIDTHPIHEGMQLKNVVWDMGRSRFTAETTLEHHGLPIFYIPTELASWINIGWRLGSYLDDLAGDVSDDVGEEVADQEEADEQAEDEPSTEDLAADPDDLIPTLAPRQREKTFNKLFRALIRVVAEEQPGTPTAYAMWKTSRFFTDKQLKGNETKGAKQFRQAVEEFKQMGFSKQFDWSMKVCRSLPRIDRIVTESMKTAKR